MLTRIVIQADDDAHREHALLTGSQLAIVNMHSAAQRRSHHAVNVERVRFSVEQRDPRLLLFAMLVAAHSDACAYEMQCSFACCLIRKCEHYAFPGWCVSCGQIERAVSMRCELFTS